MGTKLKRFDFSCFVRPDNRALHYFVRYLADKCTRSVCWLWRAVKQESLDWLLVSRTLQGTRRGSGSGLDCIRGNGADGVLAPHRGPGLALGQWSMAHSAENIVHPTGTKSLILSSRIRIWCLMTGELSLKEETVRYYHNISVEYLSKTCNMLTVG
ncbi:hypothetical protein BGZ63DRAFT_386395 [Mariannaea sp. PMI_226]|nr:hypothetical protein BGZ63DRAFT_386395 [Mariannaea sp. PMI_226]